MDTIVGTSAGTITAGFVGSGLSPDAIFARERRDHAGHHRVDRESSDDRQSGSSENGRPSATPGVSVQRYFDDITGGCWPLRPDIRFCAVDIGNGRRTMLDAESGASLGQAVAASCSIRGLSMPVRVGRRLYVDGAVRSENSVDLVRFGRPELVIISAPLSVGRGRVGSSPS